MKLVLEVELQFYGEDEDEQANTYAQVANTLDSVCQLMGVSCGVFTKSQIVKEN